MANPAQRRTVGVKFRSGVCEHREPAVVSEAAAFYPCLNQPSILVRTRHVDRGGILATPAKTLIERAQSKQKQVAGKKPAHPDEISDLHVSTNLALAQSNVELAEAIKASTDASAKNSGTIKDALSSLATKLTDLAKR
jgi:hypothetical protein